MATNYFEGYLFPTDTGTKGSAEALVSALAERGIAAVIVTHDSPQIPFLVKTSAPRLLVTAIRREVRGLPLTPALAKWLAKFPVRAAAPVITPSLEEIGAGVNAALRSPAMLEWAEQVAAGNRARMAARGTK